jgi:hypothetical protein
MGEERRLSVYEIMVLRRIFVPKKYKVTRKAYGLYSSTNIFRVLKSRRMRWTGHVVRMVERRVTYMIVMGTHEGRRPLGTPRKRWEDNIKMDVQEVGWVNMDWILLAQDRDRRSVLVNEVMKFRVS